jgi:putative NADPH-quinone reductase
MNAVFVYSGTGNSLASAKLIAGHFEAQLLNVTAELDGEFSGDVGVLVYPVYAYGMPMTVKKWIKRCRFHFNYFAVVTTCGSH